MKKRIGSLLLILALCFTLLPTAAFAAETMDTWDGTADTSWYDENETEFTLTTAEELAGLAALVNKGNTFENKTVKLGGNINLSGSEWTSIGSGGQGWRGTFDGQNYQINNLKTRKTDTDPGHGLFYYITSGTVENLSVVDADIESSSGNFNMGILADWTNGSVTIRNCHTSGTIHNKTGNKLLGGVIGSAKAGAQIIGCSSDAEIISDYYDDGDGYSDCDTVGGIVGQWENATDAALISDCWFGGSISCGFNDSGVGGILGANFDFYENQPGVDIQNCLVATREIRCAEPGNITWIGAVVNGQVTNCLWPDSPPSDVVLDPDIYPDYNGNYLAVIKMVVDLEAGTAGADPNFDQSSCGTAVPNFTSEDVLDGLQTNVGTGVKWVAGINHPTFDWDVWHIPADYSDVDAAIAAAKAIDSNLYSNYADVEKAINAVDRNKSKAEQAEVDAMADAITAAVNALTYKNADYTAVDAAIAKANALNKDEYKDFTAVEAAVNAVVRGKNITEQTEVDAMAQAIENAINALVRKSSGGGDSDPTYAIKVGKDIRNGTVTANRRYAERGDTVTITVKPDDGFKLDDLTVTDKNGKELKLTDKGNGKYTFTMPAGKIEINAAFVKEVEISPFSDVSTSAYYYEAVKWAQEKGITGGIGNGLFGPNQPCTRAQIVTFLWRAAGSPVVNYAMNMTDVAEDAYYAEAVRWALSEGITTGTGDGKFSPDTTCTRAQAVTFLYRASGAPAVSGNAAFSDVATNAYYAAAVKWAEKNGITGGIGGGLFGSGNDCTRAQIVTFLYRTYQGK